MDNDQLQPSNFGAVGSPEAMMAAQLADQAIDAWVTTAGIELPEAQHDQLRVAITSAVLFGMLAEREGISSTSQEQTTEEETSFLDPASLEPDEREGLRDLFGRMGTPDTEGADR